MTGIDCARKRAAKITRFDEFIRCVNCDFVWWKFVWAVQERGPIFLFINHLTSIDFEVVGAV
jgi:hypothetical protein